MTNEEQTKLLFESFNTSQKLYNSGDVSGAATVIQKALIALRPDNTVTFEDFKKLNPGSIHRNIVSFDEDDAPFETFAPAESMTWTECLAQSKVMLARPRARSVVVVVIGAKGVLFEHVDQKQI